MRTQALAAMLFVCLSCTRALQQPPVKSAPIPEVYAVTIVDHSRPKLTLEQLQPAEMPEAFEATFRLMPDRRVLAAVADIAELSTGHKESNVEIDFRNGAWQIRCAGQDVGSLPELATFHADLDLLTQWATRLRNQRRAAAPLSPAALAAVDRDIEAFTPPNLFAAIDRIAKQTGAASLDGKAAERAAHAATRLDAQVFDSFELSDPLAARALALVAIATADDTACCIDDQAVLAYRFGYQSEAGEIAAKLPATSFGAAFVHGDVHAKGPAFGWIAQDGALRRTTLSEFRGSMDAQAASLLGEFSSFDDQMDAARAGQSLILREVESNQFNRGEVVFGADPKSPIAYSQLNFEEKTPLARFDSALPRRIKTLQNTLLDSDAIRSYYQSNFWSALDKEYAFHTYRRFVQEDTNAFLAALGTPTSAASSQILAWMRAEADATYNVGDHLQNPAEIIRSTTLAGGSQQAELMEAIGAAKGTNRLSVRTPAVELYQHLDCRAQEIWEAGRMSRYLIADRKHRDRYISVAVDRFSWAVPWDERAFYLFSVSDRAGLRALIEKNRNDGDRASALRYLSQIGDEDSEFIHKQFDEITDRNPAIGIIQKYVDYLDQQGDPQIKERLMRRWLAQNHKGSTAIDDAWAASLLANALERQGKYKEAWDVIAPHVRVYSEIVLNQAASILQHLGRIEQANEIDRDAVNRYNDTSSRSYFASVLWREGRFDEAAALFDPAKNRYSVPYAMQNLPKQFVETYKEQPPQSALPAYKALIAVNLDDSLLDSIPQKALDAHRPELAFALSELLVNDPSRAVAANHPESITALLVGYRALKAVKGPDAALAWLAPRIPSGAAMQAIIVFYQDAEYDLVQRFASSVGEMKSTEIATLEAASLLAMQVPQSDPRWQQLDQRIRSLSSGEAAPIARHLAGQGDEKAMFAVATSTRSHSDVEYFAGVKAMSNHDYDRALAMIVGASFGPENWPPAGWALSQLYRWTEANQSWQTIAKGEPVTAAP